MVRLKTKTYCFVILIFGLVVGQNALAKRSKSSGSGIDGFSTSLAIMALTNSTQQGGQGTAGSTLLTESTFNYHWGSWGLGAFFQFDKQGDSESDIATGPRLEGTFNPFYVEFGYAAVMNRSYTDRAIKEQTGRAYFFGLGTRFQLGTGAWFIQSTYKYRTQTITEQDGEELDEPITQIDGYPLFGVGAKF